LELKDSKFKIKAIIFECKDEKERDAVLNETRYLIAGDYLVSRRGDEQRVWVTRLKFEGELGKKMLPQGKKILRLGSPESHEHWRFIPLGDWIKKGDHEHLHMHHVPRSSHWHIKSRIQGCKEMSYYENLLQISFRNQAVIYDLDHPDSCEEVEFIYNTDQFVDLDNYVNTGFTQSVSYD
jgi:hypothetical protein